MESSPPTPPFSFLSFFAAFSNHLDSRSCTFSPRSCRPTNVTVLPYPLQSHAKPDPRCLTREAEATANPPGPCPIDWHRYCDRGASSQLTDARPPNTHAVGIAHLAFPACELHSFLSPISRSSCSLASTQRPDWTQSLRPRGTDALITHRCSLCSNEFLACLS